MWHVLVGSFLGIVMYLSLEWLMMCMDGEHFED